MIMAILLLQIEVTDHTEGSHYFVMIHSLVWNGLGMTIHHFGIPNLSMRSINLSKTLLMMSQLLNVANIM